MRYLIVAEAYRDLEQVSSRLALTERLAALLAQTPDGLLPTVCYLCQGLIAPEFAGVDLGMAEKLAVRAVATAAGTDAAQVTALVRETGDLGQAAEGLLAQPVPEAAGQAAGLGPPAQRDLGGRHGEGARPLAALLRRSRARHGPDEPVHRRRGLPDEHRPVPTCQSPSADLPAGRPR